MEGKGTVHRNMVVSTKVSAAQKVYLLKLAEKHGMSMSEFVHIILESYKDQFEYIGQDNPEVEKHKNDNAVLKRKVARLEANLENADHFGEKMLQKNDALEKERDEYRYTIKEYAADNDKFKEAYDDLLIENKDLRMELKKNTPTMIDNEILKKGIKTNANLNALGAISLGAALIGSLRR